MGRTWVVPLVAAAALVPLAAAAPDTPASVEDRLRAQLALERDRHAARVRHLEARRTRQVAGLRRTLLHRPSVRGAIRLAAVTHGVDERLLLNVARCESNLRPRVVNRTPIWNGEHAHGLFQFIPSTWRAQTRQGRAGLSIFDPHANAMGAAELIRRDGLRQWHCQADGRPHP